MDGERVLACLNRALVLRQRSVLQFTIGAGSMFGLEYQAVATSCGCSRAPSSTTRSCSSTRRAKPLPVTSAQREAESRRSAAIRRSR
jgi:hypothetical protein